MLGHQSPCCSYGERYNRPELLQWSKHCRVSNPHNSTKGSDAFKWMSKCPLCKPLHRSIPRSSSLSKQNGSQANLIQWWLYGQWWIPHDPKQTLPTPSQGHITKPPAARFPKVRMFLGWAPNSKQQGHRILCGQNRESVDIPLYPLRKHSLLTGFTHGAYFQKKHFLPYHTRLRPPSLSPNSNSSHLKTYLQQVFFSSKETGSRCPVGHMLLTGRVTQMVGTTALSLLPS